MDVQGPKTLDDSDFPKLHPRFREMRDFLARVAPPGRLPGRQHIDPVAMKEMLPYINLVDVVRDDASLRFRFRLIGTMQMEIADRDITGKFVEDAVLPDYVARITGNMRTVAESKVPVYDRFNTAHPKREYIDSERVYFPLATDGQTVDMLILIHAYPGLEKPPEPLNR